MSSHFHVGIGRDYNGPVVFMYVALTRLQVSHLATQRAISIFIFRPPIKTMSARRTHKIPYVQFASSDDTVLSESVGRAAITQFYPNKSRCTILGKTLRKRFTNKWLQQVHSTRDGCEC
jgi:hypothetical protein